MPTQIPTIAVVAKKSGLQFFLPKKLVFLPKNRTKKNRLNRLKFKKKQPIRSGFGFISKKMKKPNRKKMSQTGFVLKNQTETRRFEPVSVCFKKKSVWLVTNLKAPPILPVFFTPVYYFSIQPFLQKNVIWC
jgi:hypothetical protein